jgi:uncharacterized OB-fold protein
VDTAPPLLVERCEACGMAICPPRGVCRRCGSRELTPVEVNGPLRVWSWTVNHRRWFNELDVPVVIVLVELPADPGVRLLGEFRGGADVTVGMAVRPVVERGDDGQPILTFRPERP